jgi:hypothetical protein
MATKVLDYVPQYDAMTCQSAAIARVVGSTDVRAVRNDLLCMGVPGDPAVMGEYLTANVKEYRYHGQASLDDAIEALREGYQLITHGDFTDSGHVIGLSAWNATTKKFNAKDPWFEFHFTNWSYYPYEIDGDDQQYSARGIWAACVANPVGAGAMNAYQLYLDNPTLTAAQYRQPGMWLHMIKN